MPILSNLIKHNANKRPRSSVTMDGTSFSQKVNNSRYLVADNEQGENRRAPAYVKRLHHAKYISCDAMLKEIFFPIMTYAQRFGFCSTTGIAGRTAMMLETGQTQGTGIVPSDPVSFSKSNGCHRGIALFTCRSTAIGDEDYKLNTNRVKVGESFLAAGASTTPINLYSSYRRFNNGPPIKNSLSNGERNTGGLVDQLVGVQAVDFSGPVEDQVNYNSTKIRVSEVGSLLDIEQSAFAANAFIGPNNIAGTGVPYGQAGTHVPNGNTDPDIPGQLNPSSGTIVNPDNGEYLAPFRNTTIRIADGYLEMDITNGKSMSTFVEVVIFAHKKHDASISTQELLNTIQSCVHYQQSQMIQKDVIQQLSSINEEPGGWQALYDPTYPLLGCKAQHRKPIDAIAREVHRSNHMLSAGQSKCIKIFLGSLFYDLSGKSADNMNNLITAGNALGFENCATGVGALQIAVGHSGVMQLTAPTSGGGAGAPDFSNLPDSITSNQHSVPGAGYWIGKQFCPSEIVVNGNYVEKYYPSYNVDKGRRAYQDAPLLPPYLDHPNGDVTLPAGLPVHEVIATTSASDSVPKNITTAFREEL